MKKIRRSFYRWVKNKAVVIFFICALLPTFGLAAELPDWWKIAHSYDPSKDLSDYMSYTSAFFGPNALPVPEMYDGRVPEKHQAEVSMDAFWGFGDQTQSVSTRLTYVPLPGRIAISGWGVLAEHYKTTEAIRDQRGSIVKGAEESLLIGDFYLSTLIGLTKEKSFSPDLNLEIVLKTASSKSPSNARYFDTPGYWFDLTTGKSFRFKESFLKEIRLVGSLGFLCYQLNSTRQNDATMYGGKVILSSEHWSLENGIHGYSGWQGYGDTPQVLRSKLNFHKGNTRYFMQFQYGVRDYPFRRLQAGMSLDF